MRRRERQQFVLLGGDTQFRRGSERVLSQRLRIRSGLQLLQGLHGGGRDVLGGRDKGDVADEGTQTIANVKLVGIE